MHTSRTLHYLLLALVLITGATAGAASTPPTLPHTHDAVLDALAHTDGSTESLREIVKLITKLHANLPTDKAAQLANIVNEANNPTLAKELLALQADGSLTPAEKGWRGALLTTEAQAESYGGLVPVQLANHELPSEALAGLAKAVGFQLSEEDRAEARQFDTLPAHQARALARFVDAFTAMEIAATVALASNPTAPDWGKTLSARHIFIESIIDLTEAFPEPVPMTATTSGDYHLYNLNLGYTNDLYVDNYVLSLDLGGDDEYRNNAGGNWLGNCGFPTTAAAAVDLDGSDIYSPAYKHHPQDIHAYADHCGKNGGSEGGVGFLLDHGGSNRFGSYQSRGVNGGAATAGSLGSLFSIGSNADSFQAGSEATNGGAINGGVGLMLVSGYGQNTIRGAYQGTNGGALNGGVGMMIDLSQSTSTYNSYSEGTSGGAVGVGSIGFAYGSGYWWAQHDGTLGGARGGGSGTLIALSGQVVGGSRGTVGGAEGTGSTGMLYGVSNGYYEGGDDGTVGGGTNGGRGTLVDPTGWARLKAGDRGTTGGGYLPGSSGFAYLGMGVETEAGSYGTNGGADENAVGMLLTSGSGGNGYTAGDHGTNGGANEGAVGTLIDAGWGNAHYKAGRQGTNGGAQASGWGLLLDASGNDHYEAQGYGANGAGRAQGHGSLIDLSGNDRYTCTSNTGCNGAGTDPAATGILFDGQGNDYYNGVPNQTTLLKGQGFSGSQIDASPI